MHSLATQDMVEEGGMGVRPGRRSPARPPLQLGPGAMIGELCFPRGAALEPPRLRTQTRSSLGASRGASVWSVRGVEVTFSPFARPFA